VDTEPFVIRLDSIKPDGLDVDAPVSVEWLIEVLGGGTPFRPAAAGHLQIHLDRLEQNVVHVRGRAALQLEADCSRCLEPVTLAVDTPVAVTMFPVDAEPQPAPDGELKAEDMGIATYEDEQIDIGAVIHDEVFLELPMNPLCAANCAGLCPSCGANLNQKTCECEHPVATDTRWSAFRDIKLS